MAKIYDRSTKKSSRIYALSYLKSSGRTQDATTVAGRHPAPVDVGIDILGAQIAIATVLAITARLRWRART